jgi:hypothetical protein
MGPKIDINGLKKGRRLRKLSDEARLYYPLFLGSANGYGRLELDYDSIYRDILLDFKAPLSSDRFWTIIGEYRDAGLVFLYQSGNQVWAQWFVKKGCLPQWATHEDNQSPEPPADEYTLWRQQIQRDQAPVPQVLKDIPKINKKFLGSSIRVEERRVEERREEKSRKSSGDSGEPSAEIPSPSVIELPLSRQIVAKEISVSPPLPITTNTVVESDLTNWSKPDPGEIAINLVRELHKLWPVRCSRSLAEAAAQQEILQFKSPDAFEVAVRAGFKAQCIGIAAENISAEEFFPHMHVWLRQGDYHQLSVVAKKRRPDKLAHLRRIADGTERAS